MKYYELDKIINHNLNLIYKSKSGFWHKDLKDLNNNEYQNDKIVLMRQMITRDLICSDGEKMQLLQLTPLGYEICNSIGGYLKYLEFEKEKTRRKLLKDKYDLTLSKWKYYTFWLVFFLGLFGGIYSACDFIEKISHKEQKSKKEFQNKELKDKQLIETNSI